MYAKELKLETKSGRGITPVKFLPSDNISLWAELHRLIGSYESGNTAVSNELTAVVDAMRRKGLISIAQSKKLYRKLH